jgi:hypothetical protein
MEMEALFDLHFEVPLSLRGGLAEREALQRRQGCHHIRILPLAIEQDWGPLVWRQ